jgi:hypothetical protein
VLENISEYFVKALKYEHSIGGEEAEPGVLRFPEDGV